MVLAENEVPEAEEGIVAAGMPGLGTASMTSLDVPGSESHPNVLKQITTASESLARHFKKRLELVYFGPEGRQHVRWIEP